jgi:uncharacterized protein
MLIDRKREQEELNRLLAAPSAQLVAVSGRRRLGKTTLLRHWAQGSGYPFLYWVGSHFPSSVLLAQFSQQVWQLGNPGKRAPRTFSYESWSHAFEELALICQGAQRYIVIIDELPYAIAAEPGLPSALQNAWDHHLKFSNLCMVLCGSHVGMMEKLIASDAPLFGRVVGPLRVGPLPYAALSLFLPRYTAEQRVAVYAMIGGVPAYLERFSDSVSVTENLRNNLFRETGLFRIDPDYLIGEHVRDLKNYQAVLAAIAEGAHKPTDISLQAGFSNRASADVYLSQLIEMDYVQRELPVTVPPKKRSSARVARYMLADNYLRFYFRFVRPNLDIIAQELYTEVEQRISDQLRAFIGMTAFEDICRAWLLLQAQLGALPFSVEQVGSHWDKSVQIDAVAISWRTLSILLGEAKWQADLVGCEVIHELLVIKQPKVLASLPENGVGWHVHLICFARSGFTPAAQQLANEHGVQLVSLQRLDADLNAAF